jgi:short-subunit dehydrogenase
MSSKAGFTLITGASSGIGEAFAKELAKRKHNLVLAARSADKLQEMSNELSRAHGIECRHLPVDLSVAGAAERVVAFTTGGGLEVDWLINNAGFGTYGKFCDLPLERELEMIRLNVSALVALTHHYLGAMLKRKRGVIVNVASTAGFQPVPYLTTYAATKAFVLNFTQALAYECEGTGVFVSCLCPGTTATRFHEVAGMQNCPAAQSPGLRAAGRAYRGPRETAEQVVATALHAIEKRQVVAISGRMNRIMIHSQRLAPRSVVVRAAARVMRLREAREAE